jgi:hypothetical protein
MTPFQGDLKVRSQKDLDDLKQSILTEGLLMPIALWSPIHGTHYILDGHGRHAALLQLAMQDTSILEQAFPVLEIDAATEEDARKALLQITSTYGKVSKKGVRVFAAPLVDYKAPIIKATALPVKVKHDKIESDLTIVRLKIPKDRAPEFLELIKTVSWIEVY